MLVALELNEQIGDMLKPITENFSTSSYLYAGLVNLYHRVSSMSKFVNVQNLPITNRDPRKTWGIILRVSEELIERAILKDEKRVSEAIIKTMDLVNPHQKIEYFSYKQIESSKETKNIEERIKLNLNYYHDVYEGRYKYVLNLMHFCADILLGHADDNFEKYVKNDPSYMIKKIKSYVREIKLQDTIEWILIGADEHIRNAIAHKRWKFIDGQVLLEDKNRNNEIIWFNSFNYLEIDDVVRNLTINFLALESSLIISFVKHIKNVRKYLVRKVHDSDSIRSVIQHCAEDQSFDMINITGLKEKTLIIAITDMGFGKGREILGNMRTYKFRVKLPELENLETRSRSFVLSTLPVTWNYEKIVVNIFHISKKMIAVLEMNVKQYLYFIDNKIKEKMDVDDTILFKNIL